MLDMFTVYPMFADASVDSFNDKAHGSGGAGYVPGYRLQADTIENKAGEPGVYIAVDDEDFDGDGIPGFADGFDLDGAAETADDSSDDAPLYQLVLTFPLGIGQDPPRIKLEYSASDPEAMSPNLTWPNTPFVLPEEGLIRIWRRDTYAWIGMAAMADWTSGLQGDFVAAGVGYTERDLEAGSYVENGQVTLYIQGVRPGEGTIEFWLDVDGDGEGYVLADTVKYSAVSVNLAIDSLNTEAFAEPLSGDSASALRQDQLEDYNQEDATVDVGDITIKAKWGKIVVANDNDEDYDGIPDYADGFNWDGIEGNDDDRAAFDNPETEGVVERAERFVPITITLPEPLDLAKLRLQIDYDASDPGALTRDAAPTAFGLFSYTPPSGSLRIWTTDGDEQRSMEPFYVEGGSYVPPRYNEESEPSDPQFYGPADLETLGFSSEVRSVRLYVEGIKETLADADRVTIRLDPDGDGPAGFIVQDALRITVNSLRILNGSMAPTLRLTVANWENSYEENGDLKFEFIEDDPERFYIQLVAPQLNTSASQFDTIGVMVATESPHVEYSGKTTGHSANATLARLGEGESGTSTNSYFFTSASAHMLVGDHVDDLLDGGPRRDFTHKIALGGRTIVAWAWSGYEFHATALVPREKVITDMQFIILGDAAHKVDFVTDEDWVRQDIDWANERLAQVGVYIDINPATAIQKVQVPQVVNLKSGLEPILNTSIGLPPDRLALFNMPFMTAETDDIIVFYANLIKTPPGQGLIYGQTTFEGFMDKLKPPQNQGKYRNNVVVSMEARRHFIMIHEMLHAILNTDSHAFPPYNVSSAPLDPGGADMKDDSVFKFRRLNSIQESTILKSKFVRNP